MNKKKEMSDKEFEKNQKALKNILVKLTTKNFECGSLDNKADKFCIAKNIVDMDNYLAMYRTLHLRNEDIHRQTIINMSRFIIKKLEFVLLNNESEEVLHNRNLFDKFNRLRYIYYATMYGESLH